MWTRGETSNGYNFIAKVYDEGSQYGINEGRISKIDIYNESGRAVATYDRGWDMEPATSEAKAALEEILESYK